jgi:AraC-like DNA-binding protein
MKNKLIGQSWSRKSKPSPAVVSVVEATGKKPFAIYKMAQPFWVLDYEFAGYGRYRAGSARRPWQERLPQTGHLYPPRTTYWEDTRQESKPFRHSAWISFSGGRDARLNELVHTKRRYARFLDPGGELGRVIREAARIGQVYGTNGFWGAQACLCQAIDLLLRSEPVEEETYRVLRTPRSPRISDFVWTIQQFLKDRLSERVTLGRIARHAHVSVSTLSHRYRDETGETPMETLTQMRISRAKALLLKGIPLKAMADQLGFSDEFHLSKTFKLVQGVSPRMFIKGH